MNHLKIKLVSSSVITGMALTMCCLLFCASCGQNSIASAQRVSQAAASGKAGTQKIVSRIGNHPAVYDAQGILMPWISWREALRREMEWYQRCPQEQGYPRFVIVTFMEGDYTWMQKRPDTIPAMQNGMGILSYLKYYAFLEKSGTKDPRYLATARAMGDFLVKECDTPADAGFKYPGFTRSTGRVGKWPLPADCGSQADQPHEIEPDKGGIAGYALGRLYEETKDEKYLRQALSNAHTLVANMRTGDATHSPWPFRADYRTGAVRGEISANMSYILRLFDLLLTHSYKEFETPRTQLWHWIKTVQIPNATPKQDGMLWTQFFEDYALTTNRNSWSPLNLARYLLERKAELDPEWQQDAKTLIEFAQRHFAGVRNGVPICGEQDDDKEPWGGANSTYGAVLAMYGAATGSPEYRGLAYQALNFSLYATNDDGCPGQTALYPKRGGWQEDAHTDKIHNYIDAIIAVPEWGR